MGDDVPLLDQQIAMATQATIKYYGSGGLEQAIADGYLPFTQEVTGHGIHYFNFNLATEVGNFAELEIERPVGLNYDNGSHGFTLTSKILIFNCFQNQTNSLVPSFGCYTDVQMSLPLNLRLFLSNDPDSMNQSRYVTE